MEDVISMPSDALERLHEKRAAELAEVLQKTKDAGWNKMSEAQLFQHGKSGDKLVAEFRKVFNDFDEVDAEIELRESFHECLDPIPFAIQ